MNFLVVKRGKRRRQWHPTPVLLPGKSHRRRSLEGCSPWGRWGSDTTEWLHVHFSLSCIGEGNGNPLQCSCLENPREGWAWWAAVYGVAQSRTRLKRLSSSSSRNFTHWVSKVLGARWALADSKAGQMIQPEKQRRWMPVREKKKNLCWTKRNRTVGS